MQNNMVNEWAVKHYPFGVEIWKEIPGFPGYEASTFGNLRTYWYKVRNTYGQGGTHRELWDVPRPLPVSPKADGHLHTNLYCDLDGKRYTRTVQVLVARTFLPFPEDFDIVDYTVDHIRPGEDGKRDNSVWNLQWLSRADNIRKAYRDGVCSARINRQRKPVMVQNLWDGEWTFYHSIDDAANDLHVTHSTVSHALSDGRYKVGHYIVEYADEEDRLLYGLDDYDYEIDQYY